MTEPIHPSIMPALLSDAADDPDHPYGQMYVAGFLFRDDHDVALIRKIKPEWQKNKLNGIGGKVEPGETPRAAMRREFFEEAGLALSSWRPFCLLASSDEAWAVLFFTAALPEGASIQTMTDERVLWISPGLMDFAATNCVQNLKWLVRLAQDPDQLETFVIQPVAGEEAKHGETEQAA